MLRKGESQVSPQGGRRESSRPDKMLWKDESQVSPQGGRCESSRPDKMLFPASQATDSQSKFFVALWLSPCVLKLFPEETI